MKNYVMYSTSTGDIAQSWRAEEGQDQHSIPGYGIKEVDDLLSPEEQQVKRVDLVSLSLVSRPTDAVNLVKAMQVRHERSILIAGSDWTQLPDAQLSAEQRLAWAAYRQALRDVPEQPGFPLNVIWPEKPA